MNFCTIKNEQKLSIILSTIKFFIIVFICIIFFFNYPLYWSKFNIDIIKNYNVYITGLCLCAVVLMTLAFLLSNTKIYQTKDVFRISWLLENIFFIAIISFPIYFFAAYESEYKYIFLLLIVASTIQYGSRYGTITSIVTSFVILIADLIYAPTVSNINLYFQKDLIMVGIFVFIAWVLGYYVDLGIENNKQKDAKLKILNSKLAEKNKDRKEIEEFLIKNKICYDVLFENSVKSIIVHNNGKIIYANESASRLLGHKNPLNLEQNNFYDYYPNNDKSLVKSKYSKILNNKLLKAVNEEKILSHNGELISVKNSSFFIIYNGNPCIITFLLDLSKEKQIETLKSDVENKLKLLNESREFNTILTEFFTNISHELKTPINVIYVAVQTMNKFLYSNDKSNIEKCNTYLNMMKQNCQRMIRLVNNLIDTVKANSGFLQPNMKNNDIVSFIENIVQSISLYINSKNIEIIFDTNVEERIMAFDQEKMERIILNLLSNAFKFTEHNGHIYVNIEDKNKEIIITVKDDGVGIPKDKLNIIFERFGQANSSLSREHEGSGIGLYLVKSFVTMHEGEITVNSIEGKGTEFNIKLPIKINPTEENNKNLIVDTNAEKINIEFSDIYS